MNKNKNNTVIIIHWAIQILTIKPNDNNGQSWTILIINIQKYHSWLNIVLNNNTISSKTSLRILLFSKNRMDKHFENFNISEILLLKVNKKIVTTQTVDITIMYHIK